MTERKKLPRTREELIADIESNPQRGFLGGEPLFLSGVSEVRGLVSVDIYNKALLIGAANGLTSKQAIATVALTNFNAAATTGRETNAQGEGYEIYFEKTYESSREFRTVVANSLRQIFKTNVQQLGIATDSSGFCYALFLFINNPGYLAVYERFVEEQKAKHSVEEEDVIKSIYGYWRQLGRQKRLNLVNEGNAEALERKMI